VQVSPSMNRPQMTAKAGKTMFLRFIYVTIILGLFVALLTITIDPLQFYRQASWYSPIYSNEQRYQNPGLARHYDYDTIILGTSMTENFLPSEVDRAMGGHSLKLSMRGSTSDEQYKIAELALQTGKVKRVIWGIDYFALKMNDQPDNNNVFPDYLYDNNVWNDYSYWYSFSIYKQFAVGISRKLFGNEPTSIEYLYNWNSKVNYSATNVLQAYDEARYIENSFELNEQPLEVVQQNFNTYVLSLVEQYPDVAFNFYYPPYSILRQRVWKDTNNLRYDNQMTMRNWMFRQLDQYRNTRVYDFQSEQDWTYNLALYKDLSHHNEDVNTWIAQAIGRGDERYLVTEQNTQSFTDQLIHQVNSVLITEDDRVIHVDVELNNNALQIPLFIRNSIPYENELFVPSKELVKVLGATIEWDQAAKKMTLNQGSNVIQMTIGSTDVIVNGSAMTMPYPAKIVNNTTLVPLSFTASMLGYKVEQEKVDEYSTVFKID
jgi:hypothetical protein